MVTAEHEIELQVKLRHPDYEAIEQQYATYWYCRVRFVSQPSGRSIRSCTQRMCSGLQLFL